MAGVIFLEIWNLIRACLVWLPKKVPSLPLDPTPLSVMVKPLLFRNCCRALTSGPESPCFRERVKVYLVVVVVGEEVVGQLFVGVFRLLALEYAVTAACVRGPYDPSIPLLEMKLYLASMVCSALTFDPLVPIVREDVYEGRAGRELLVYVGVHTVAAVLLTG